MQLVSQLVTSVACRLRNSVSSQDTFDGEITGRVKWKYNWPTISSWFRAFDKCISCESRFRIKLDLKAASIIQSIIDHPSLTLRILSAIALFFYGRYYYSATAVSSVRHTIFSCFVHIHTLAFNAFKMLEHAMECFIKVHAWTRHFFYYVFWK